MKLKAATIYRISYELKCLGIFYLYFFASTIIIPGILFVLFTISDNGSNEVISDLVTPAAILILIVSLIGIKSDFKFFLQNGLNRNSIFLSTIISNFIISNCIVISTLLIKQIAGMITGGTVNFSLFIVDQYAPATFIQKYLLLLLLFLFICSIGMTVGFFLNRLSPIIQIIGGIGVLLLPFLIATIYRMLNEAQRSSVVDFCGNLLGISKNGLNSTPLMLTLLALTFVNVLISYLMNRRRELQRIS